MQIRSARPLAFPGCPDLAFCTASPARVRIVLMQPSSIVVDEAAWVGLDAVFADEHRGPTSSFRPSKVTQQARLGCSGLCSLSRAHMGNANRGPRLIGDCPHRSLRVDRLTVLALVRSGCRLLLSYSVSQTMAFGPSPRRMQEPPGRSGVLVSWKRSSRPQMARAQNTRTDTRVRLRERYDGILARGIDQRGARPQEARQSRTTALGH